MKILFFLLALPLISFGQTNEECYVEKSFIILLSTKDYNEALTIAESASKSLGFKLDTRDLTPVTDKQLGLSLPADTCLKYSIGLEEQDTNCYIARGRYDDGIYISIEYSNAYLSFAKGYYIVISGSGMKEDKELSKTLKKVKTKFSDAYIKSSKVYMCCMH